MKIDPARFVGDIPKNYDDGLGPVLFAGYARDIAARAAALKPARVLETAAGAGVVTRALRDSLPAETEIVATDLNPPMLEIAKARFKGERNVAIEPANAIALPYLDTSFDLVLCQFGLMFFPDKPASFREAKRVLRPSGRYLFSVWDSHEKNRFARIALEAGAEGFETDPPKFYETPFSLSSIDQVRALVEDAGFARLDVSVLRSAPGPVDPQRFARALVFGNALVDELKARGGDPEAVVRRIEARLRDELGLPRRPLSLQAIIYSAAI